MSTQVQYRRGSAAEIAAFTGAVGELLVDTTNKLVYVSDGSTSGGFAQVGLTAAQTITNKTYQGNIVTVTGNITGGNLITAGLASVTGNISGNFFIGNGSQLTGIDSTGISSGTSNVKIVSSGANATVSVGGSANIAVFATTGAVITGVTTVTGNITGGNVTTAGKVTVNSGDAAIAIANGGTSGVGNIGATGATFNTVFAKATTAQYADLAENYMPDEAYNVGVVVIFGGDEEITICSEFADPRVAGVISDNPAYLMNSAADGIPVALRGRVKINVMGPVTKGDGLVTDSMPGNARSIGLDRTWGQAVFAKSLETHLSPGSKVIEAVIL